MRQSYFSHKTGHTQSERIIGAISVGFVFILLGTVFILALPSNLLEKTVNFFGSLTGKQVPNTGVYLPAPVNPQVHSTFYTAVFQFFLGLILLQIIVLTLRLSCNSPKPKTAETLGDFVFWAGAAWLATTFLGSQTTDSSWFAFWAGMLIMTGFSLITRALVLLLRK